MGPFGTCALLLCSPACDPVLYLLQDLFYTTLLPSSLSRFFPLLALDKCLSACEINIHLQKSILLLGFFQARMCVIPCQMLGTVPGTQEAHNKCLLNKCVNG